MKFSVPTIAAKPGEQIRVRLAVKGGMPKIAMAHNFVLLAKSADTLKFVNAAALARTTDFIPPEMKAQVLASTDPRRRRGDRRGHVQGADRSRRVHVSLLVPRSLPGAACGGRLTVK